MRFYGEKNSRSQSGIRKQVYQNRYVLKQYAFKQLNFKFICSDIKQDEEERLN